MYAQLALEELKERSRAQMSPGGHLMLAWQATDMVPAAKPEQPELVLQQPSKLQDGCSIGDQAGLASWMESFSGQGNALPPCEHPAS